MIPENDETENLKILRGGTMPAASRNQSDLLEAFPNKFPDNPYMINLIFPEFTSLCPVTSQPDFGTIVVEYIPNKLCVESKSLKLYLFSFRNRGSFMETITNMILNDLYSLLSPHWIRIKGLFAPRGATRINVYAEKKSMTIPEPLNANINQMLDAWRMELHLQGHPLI